MIFRQRADNRPVAGRLGIFILIFIFNHIFNHIAGSKTILRQIAFRRCRPENERSREYCSGDRVDRMMPGK
jgi:hypothetical protein